MLTPLIPILADSTTLPDAGLMDWAREIVTNGWLLAGCFFLLSGYLAKRLFSELKDRDAERKLTIDAREAEAKELRARLLERGDRA